ncbi:MAG: CCA tRNA nucleotidyltransferase [Thermoguttaceae bacterium]
MALSIPRHVLKIIDLLQENGATDVLIVGGFVRDYLLGIPSKDFDIEAYGLSYAQIRDILSGSFRVDIVGQAFGVLKVGRDVDVALPRRESKNGLGHKGFNVEWSSNISPREAFARRDFTVNAIGMRRDGSFCDPFNGIDDLKHKRLRATSDAFKDDPLRVLRGMQFAARFGFTTEPKTLQYCREVLPEFNTLSQERVYEEWKKWALKGQYPDSGLTFLRDSGWTQAFPELHALTNGNENAWRQTLHSCQEMANLVQERRSELSDDERIYLMFSALTYAFDAPTPSDAEKIAKRRLRRNAKNVSAARLFFEKMKAPTRVLGVVGKLAEEETPLFSPPKESSIRRLAHRLQPGNIKLWALLHAALEYANCERDENGDQTAKISRPQIRKQMEIWIDEAASRGLLESGPEPLVKGRDIVSMGISPGPQMGNILTRAFEAQLDGLFSTTKDGVSFIKEMGWIKE